MNVCQPSPRAKAGTRTFQGKSGAPTTNVYLIDLKSFRHTFVHGTRAVPLVHASQVSIRRGALPMPRLCSAENGEHTRGQQFSMSKPAPMPTYQNTLVFFLSRRLL